MKSGEVVCALFDVSEMQVVNEKQGYEFGNHVLADIEVKLKSYFTSSEVRRLGGDEFIVTTAAGDSAKISRNASAVSDEVKKELRVGLAFGVGVGTNLTEAKQGAVANLFHQKLSFKNAAR